MLGGLRQLGRVFGLRRSADDGVAFRWDARPSSGRASAEVTVFHVTHHKAGSQWVNRILHSLAFDRLVMPTTDVGQFLGQPIQRGKVYPTVYVTREQFDGVKLPPNSRRFVVIRDLRDTLVSAYFSVKHSHAPADEHNQMRARLREATLDDGLLYLLDTWFDRPNVASPPAVQKSWLGGPDDVLRYEDLLEHDERILEAVLLDHCRLPVSREKLREVVLANRFEARSGRKRGEENIASHERKGVAGDWRNHFSDRIAKTFKDRYGELLVATGYEKDARW